MSANYFWPTLAAPLLNGIALLLALGFRRNRAFMILAIMTCTALGLAGFGSALLAERGIEAFRMFAPCLLLAAAVMPERRLLAKRNLLLLGLLALAIVSWLTPSRLVRGQILTLKQNEYVEAARALGASQARVVWRHLLPNTLGIIVVAMFLEVPSMILGEAVLSFLGLGISAPNASWGTLAEEGWKALRSYPWLIILPGLFISITVLAFNFVGDGFRDAIDPRTKEGNG